MGIINKNKKLGNEDLNNYQIYSKQLKQIIIGMCKVKSS